MSCPEFEKYGILFLTEELDNITTDQYASHLHACDYCQNSLEEIRKTELAIKSETVQQPPENVSSHILNRATKKRIRKPVFDLFVETLRKQLSLSSGNWKFAAGFVTALLFTVVLQSLWNPARPTDPEYQQWDDTFISEAVWIDQEMDRIESGHILNEDLNILEETENFDQYFLNEIDSLKSDIRKLSGDLYGI